LSLRSKYRGSRVSRSDDPIRVNVVHDYFVGIEAGVDVDAYHSDVHYARLYLRDCTDFREKYGYVPSLKQVEQALIQEFGQLRDEYDPLMKLEVSYDEDDLYATHGFVKVPNSTVEDRVNS